ncbi:MAG: helix-turn-helix transcriptional regulator [Uliginosibacterium sp.]|jgi:DNA-binding HxlR family transcriptional regulator|nr:helix-turn-helix transcriptional regulator [Uliginosibacterium sp.]
MKTTRNPTASGDDTGCTLACPVAKTAQLIDGRWTTLIVRDLLSGKKRYSELLSSLQGISPKMLAARLRFLEAQGLVSKTIYAVVPPKTEYELTAKGQQLHAVIQAMATFGAGLAD